MASTGLRIQVPPSCIPSPPPIHRHLTLRRLITDGGGLGSMYRRGGGKSMAWMQHLKPHSLDVDQDGGLIIYLIDASGSMSVVMPQVVVQLKESLVALQEKCKHTRVVVLTFQGNLNGQCMRTCLDSKVKDLSKGLVGSLSIQSGGSTPLYAAMYETLSAIPKDAIKKASIGMITDGANTHMALQKDPKGNSVVATKEKISVLLRQFKEHGGLFEHIAIGGTAQDTSMELGLQPTLSSSASLSYDILDLTRSLSTHSEYSRPNLQKNKRIAEHHTTS